MTFGEINENAKRISRKLRKNSTEAEKILWDYLRNRKLNNIKFLRQHRIFYSYDNELKFFIPDFYCPHKKLIIEVDGEIHRKTIEEDLIRENILKCLDFQIVRFNNDDVINSIDKVLCTIRAIINK